MNILQATKSYEGWMRTCTTLVESQIRDKHARMKKDLYAFFRGTFRLSLAEGAKKEVAPTERSTKQEKASNVPVAQEASRGNSRQIRLRQCIAAPDRSFGLLSLNHT